MGNGFRCRPARAKFGRRQTLIEADTIARVVGAAVTKREHEISRAEVNATYTALQSVPETGRRRWTNHRRHRKLETK